MPRSLLAALCLLAGAVHAGETVRLESPATRVTLLELYTSEGCSSCPPADRWMSELVGDPRLWRDVVPVAFHVDYWNYLGWPDRFASAAYGNRQRNYAAQGHVRTVYTPGLVVGGQEWRGWFNRPSLDVAAGLPVGTLAVTVEDGAVSATFAPQVAARAGLELHVALLGFGLTTDVRAGENAGRELRHDFVVLGYGRADMSAARGSYRAGMPLPEASAPAPRNGLAAWVSLPGDQRPLQAVGGWLP